MNTVKALIVLVFFTVMSSVQAQQTHAQDRRADRMENLNRRPNHGKKACKHLKKRHMRSMRKMAAADGHITPREKQLLRRERRRVF